MPLERQVAMFTRRFKLFNLFGFPLYIDLSWFLILFVLVWSLSVAYFPSAVEGLSAGTYWAMGLVGALALFASVVLHELGHALAARRFGIEMRGITLFVFGGVAEMANEPPSAKAEFVVAIAGPLVSIALAGLFFLGSTLPLPIEAALVISYLALINFILVVFNMVPAFPLDGGRVLRSILWYAKGNLTWATRITSGIGAGFGIVLMLLGGLMLFMGDFVSAVWFFLLGMFLRGAAQASYHQLMVRQALEGEPVYKFMRPNPITVETNVPLDSFVHDFVFRHHYKLYPVVDNGRLLGCMSTRQLKQLPQEDWPYHTVGDVLEPCSPANAIEDTADVSHALMRMNQEQVSRLIVTHEGRLVGILALKDLMDYLNLKLELAEPDRAELRSRAA